MSFSPNTGFIPGGFVIDGYFFPWLAVELGGGLGFALAALLLFVLFVFERRRT